MKSKTHAMAEAITAALGPIFHANPDYKTITEAVALTVARVAQATIDRGFEHQRLDGIFAMASHALTEFLNAEEAIQEQRSKIIQRGIDAFAEMVPLDGDDGPAFGLAALHGDLGVEARDAAEAFAGQDHAEVERSACRPYRDEEGDITPEGHVQLKKDILDSMREEDQTFNDLAGLPEGVEVPVGLYGNPDSRIDPDGVFVTPTEASWSNSPIHEEITRFEQEHPEVNNGYEPDRHNPDGPRAYL